MIVEYNAEAAPTQCPATMQQASSALEEALQNSDSQRGACANITAALVKKPLSAHQDKVMSPAAAPQSPPFAFTRQR